MIPKIYKEFGLKCAFLKNIYKYILRISEKSRLLKPRSQDYIFKVTYYQFKLYFFIYYQLNEF